MKSIEYGRSRTQIKTEEEEMKIKCFRMLIIYDMKFSILHDKYEDVMFQ